MQVECKQYGNNQAAGDPRDFPTVEDWWRHAFCCHRRCQEFPAQMNRMAVERAGESTGAGEGSES